MTAERLVRRWVRLYTRNLAAPTARRRAEEIDADLHDHIAHERAQGTGERRIALGVVSRMVRGMPADASWRRRHVTGPLRLDRVAVATVCVLLVPLVAMQLTGEVAWTVFDFAFASVLVGGTGLAFELAIGRAGNLAYRAAVGLALVAAFLLVWITGAVGIIGDEGDPANLMYGAVLAVGIIGVVAARFRPAGMARALLATALAQTLVTLIALVVASPETLALNAFFVALFVASAWLFRRAARGLEVERDLAAGS